MVAHFSIYPYTEILVLKLWLHSKVLWGLRQKNTEQCLLHCNLRFSAVYYIICTIEARWYQRHEKWSRAVRLWPILYLNISITLNSNIQCSLFYCACVSALSCCGSSCSIFFLLFVICNKWMFKSTRLLVQLFCLGYALEYIFFQYMLLKLNPIIHYE